MSQDSAATKVEKHHHHGRLAQDVLEIPRIPLDLWKYKTPIAIQWTILFISSCVIPIVFYFTLLHVAHLKLWKGMVFEIDRQFHELM